MFFRLGITNTAAHGSNSRREQLISGAESEALSAIFSFLSPKF